MSSTLPKLDSSENHGQQDESTSSAKPLPTLPAPEATGEGETTKLDVSGDGSTVKLDHLGPLVVNQDGTLSRIGNWAEMSEIERKNTLRVLGKRNQLRLTKLRGETDCGAGTANNPGKEGE